MARVAVAMKDRDVRNIVADVLREEGHESVPIGPEEPDAVAQARVARADVLVLEIWPTAEGLLSSAGLDNLDDRGSRGAWCCAARSQPASKTRRLPASTAAASSGSRSRSASRSSWPRLLA